MEAIGLPYHSGVAGSVQRDKPRLERVKRRERTRKQRENQAHSLVSEEHSDNGRCPRHSHTVAQLVAFANRNASEGNGIYKVS